MKRPKVLFLGGGRRVELARLFELQGCDVVGYETDATCPLADEAEVVEGLPWKHPDFGKHLSDTCALNGVKAVVPLQDAGVVALASADLPAGVEKVCSPELAALTTHDKLLFEQFCQANFPDHYPTPELFQPAIVKPRFGFGSRGVMSMACYRSSVVARLTPECVAQRELPEPEFTVDAYFNRDGAYIGSCPRQRLRVAGGEVVEAETVWDDALDNAARVLGEGMGLRGPVCFQFRYGESEIPQVIECNARFGGGSTLSCEAGLPLVAYVVHEYVRGETVPPHEVQGIRYGLRLSRSYRDHFFEAAK